MSSIWIQSDIKLHCMFHQSIELLRYLFMCFSLYQDRELCPLYSFALTFWPISYQRHFRQVIKKTSIAIKMILYVFILVFIFLLFDVCLETIIPLAPFFSFLISDLDFFWPIIYQHDFQTSKWSHLSIAIKQFIGA